MDKTFRNSKIIKVLILINYYLIFQINHVYRGVINVLPYQISAFSTHEKIQTSNLKLIKLRYLLQYMNDKF